MSAEILRDTRSNKDYLISAKNIWEKDFTWISRIMKITFLCPFQKRSIQIIGNICVTLYLLISLAVTILKIAGILRANQTLNSTMVECIFQLMIFLIMIFCYLRMVVCREELHNGVLLMGRMSLTHAQETQPIMLKILKKGYRISIFQAVAIIILCASFGVSPVAIPSFLNWAFPDNQTYEKTLPFHTEMFLSEDEFFYQIFAVQLASSFIYGLLISVLNCFQYFAVTFIIAQIRVLEYFLHKMSWEYKFKILVDDKIRDIWICEQVKNLVDTHKICIEYFNVVHDISNILIFGVLIGATCIVVLTATSMVILMETDLTGSAKMMFAFCITMCAITFVCFPSQMLKNASEDLFFTCYEMNRLSYPLKVRKMLLFIMVRVTKPLVLTGGPTIELNFETCSSIIKSSLSYAAAFRSFYTS